MNIIIPVARPLLPLAARIVPYLDEIDSGRIYSNFGPLVLRLEERLCERFGLSDGSVTTVANGTLGLMLGLMSSNAEAGSLCIMPAWTFAATAEAAMAAGLKPYFVDVEENSWALSPETVREAVKTAPGPVGAVMPVAPFGCPIDTVEWDNFSRQTGIAVVIDAAAGFDKLRPSGVVSVVSLHATKILGAGEGGFAVSTDVGLMEELRSRSNFGFSVSRQAAVRAFNAKMSEYHAAVALAALDAYPETREAFNAVVRLYQRYAGAVAFQDGQGDNWAAAACVVRGGVNFAANAADKLGRNKIQTRAWWERGLHLQPAFSECRREALPVTEMLADSTLGLPCFVGMGEADVRRVCSFLA